MIAYFMLLAHVGASGLPQDVPPVAAPGSTAGLEVVSAALVLKRVPSGGAGEASPEEIVARIQALRRDALEGGDPVARRQASVSAANLVLAHQAAEAATKLFLGVATAGDRAELRKAAEEAQTLIRSALAEISQPGDGGRDADGDLRRIAGNLETLADAYLACAGDDAPPVETIKALLARLGVLSESDDPGLSDAALIWSAQLALSTPEVLPVVDSLPLAWSEPEASRRVSGLYLRLKRCELLAHRGGYAAALGLLNRLEEEAPSWFSGAESDLALRSVALFRLRVTIGWESSFSGETPDAVRAWYKQRKDALTARIMNGGEVSMPLVNPLVTPSMR
ncbi:MAG: hypothetical protein FLDDKLPJ_01451 [Phycisphaerae bacterium]|nr:hypothetical protein [Phycisphaerae bacterium]